MFTNIELKNYKSLVDINVNFTDSKKQPKKLVLLYGENGGGKSNLVSAFSTLIDMIKTLEVREFIASVVEEMNEEVNIERIKLLQKLRNNYRDLETIIQQTHTCNSEENMVLKYSFNIDGKEGYYYIETDNDSIVKEELYYVINKNKGYHFQITKDKSILNPNIFKNKIYNEELYDKIEKFWGKHTFLSIINYELVEKNKSYVHERLSPRFLEVFKFFSNFCFRVNEGTTNIRIRSGIEYNVLDELLEGQISSTKEYLLKISERFLNQFFTQLYADIKNVYYVKKKDEENIKYDLWCKKLIGNKIRDIKFRNESTGTLQLLELIPLILASIGGNVAIIDEFDTGIHDLLVTNIVTALNDSIDGQLIMTTHNTLLMENQIPKDSLYFIVTDSDGNKEIPCLTDYERRTYPRNNIRDLYLKGMYEGIPSMMDIDFEDILETMKDN
ncbi:AAA family ATPase [Vallitalea sp.]|jgi:AAA15 family ATPase/GTPase|uniref:AAA family ATPase n=1 Tax=Vallitalea sp. TaxID=1882829 RepID=UPI0025F5140C|nr:AAA family ATPase [Vallitalea sp.]MCT4688048.1 AAA family ATPase [Vallitalea sp.]